MEIDALPTQRPHGQLPAEYRLARAKIGAQLFGWNAPTTVGRFELVDRIGGGGMGVVYRARDPDLARDVAVKLLLPEGARSEVERSRMLREAQALARLSHPNVVHVYEAGTHGDEVFIAMELVRGQTLRAWRLDGTRTWREIVEVYLAAARGLAAAHTAGLVHRDFKPENVLVDDGRVARVVDFGLARADEESLETLPSRTADELRELLESKLTATGAILGTPAYMAPEQLKGEPATASSDQFSFCVALWEALHGERPFAVDATLRAAVQGEAPPTPRRCAAVPSRLASLLLRGLEVDPARRFVAMTDLIDALERGAKQGSRGRVAVIGLGAAALASAALVLASTPWGAANDEHDRPPQPAIAGLSQEPVEAPIESPRYREAPGTVGDVHAAVQHHVAPFEDLAAVAARYGVAIADLVRDNGLAGPDVALSTEQQLIVNNPAKRPLPHQRINHEVRSGDVTWDALAERFNVEADALAVWNPAVDLAAGVEVVVWIDPRPYDAPPTAPKIDVDFTGYVKPGARSIGYPSRGELPDGVQVPSSALYVLRRRFVSHGSSFAVANLLQAIVSFRRELDYPGGLVLGDMSLRDGGKFMPHRTHQSGREIDIDLPAVPGALDVGDVEKRRRPLFSEVDWYATWGLVRALVSTGAVKDIFLDWRYQELLYRAAVNAGASKAELSVIQWPRSSTSLAGIVLHSNSHLSQIHVRFQCARWETECRDETYRVAGD